MARKNTENVRVRSTFPQAFPPLSVSSLPPYFFALSGFAPGRLARISICVTCVPGRKKLLCTVIPSAQTKPVRVSLPDKQFRHVVLYRKTSRLHWTKRIEILTAWTARWRSVCFRTAWYCDPWQRQRAKFLSHLQVPVHMASSKIIHDNSQGKMVSPILWNYIKCTFLFLGYIYSDFSSLAGRAQYFTLFSLCSVACHHNLHVRYAIVEICNNKPWTGLWIF